jgi:hypothetical protein
LAVPPFALAGGVSVVAGVVVVGAGVGAESQPAAMTAASGTANKGAVFFIAGSQVS